ncbi:MAG: hypothetical protein K1X78_24230 [Verrucomicrobiaceae bacterium]|nr:hypothetical protein [Verrucomicrobiaceae bacterium]
MPVPFVPGNLNVSGLLDIYGGPLSLGTARVASGQVDQNGSTIFVDTEGFSIGHQDLGHWETTPAYITATFNPDPDGDAATQDERWEWTDQYNQFLSQEGRYFTDIDGQQVDGYETSTATVSTYDVMTGGWIGGSSLIRFVAGNSSVTYKWQRIMPDENDASAFVDVGLMTLSTAGAGASLQVEGSIIASANLVAYGGYSMLLSQTLSSSASILTRGLGDARYLLRDSASLPGGVQSGAVGQNLTANAGQFVTGKFNSANTTDLFVVGAGTSASNRKNALSVNSSGNTTVNGNLNVTGIVSGAGTISGNVVSGNTVFGTAIQGGSLQLALNFTGYGSSNTLPNQTTSAGAASILTVGLADARYLASASSSLVWGPGSGATGTGRSIALGENASATVSAASGGAPAIALGRNVSAEASEYGPFSAVALGSNAVVGGAGAGVAGGGVAIGSNNYTKAHGISIGEGVQSGAYGAAGIGQNNAAMGEQSYAFGFNNVTWGNMSLALGNNLTVNGFQTTMIGTYNVLEPAANDTARVATGHCFVVGNGTPDARSNAFTIQWNGDATMHGNATVTKNLNVTQDAQVNGNATVSGQVQAATGRFSGKVRLQPQGGLSMGEFNYDPENP